MSKSKKDVYESFIPNYKTWSSLEIEVSYDYNTYGEYRPKPDTEKTISFYINWLNEESKKVLDKDGYFLSKTQINPIVFAWRAMIQKCKKLELDKEALNNRLTAVEVDLTFYKNNYNALLKSFQEHGKTAE